MKSVKISELAITDTIEDEDLLEISHIDENGSRTTKRATINTLRGSSFVAGEGIDITNGVISCNYENADIMKF